MHILLTDPHTDGGGQVRYIESLARELVRMGHRVTIGCRTNSILVDVAHNTGCEVLPEFRFARGLRLRSWLHDLRAMRRYLESEAPDVVHVNGSQDHWVAALVKAFFLRGLCLVRTRHNTYRVKNSLVNRILNRTLTTYQICVCDMVRQSLASHPAFRPDRLTSIHNGVDADKYCPDAESRARARADLGYHPGDLVCGIAARLVKAKGHTYLFQAFQQLVDAFPEARLLILGQGALADSLKAEVRDLGLEERVAFGGFRDRMEVWVQAFDIGVLPSIDCDTSSFSLKEQMAAEIPVVASDYGGLPEIVNDGQEGFVIPHGTVGPLADALKALLADDSLRRDMGRRGRRRVLEEFTGAVFAERTAAAYETALEIDREHTAS